MTSVENQEFTRCSSSVSKTSSPSEAVRLFSPPRIFSFPPYVLSTWLVVYSFISSSSMKMQSGMHHPSDSVSYCKYIILFKTDVSGADFRDRAVSYRKVFRRISYLVLIYSRVCGRIRVERTWEANHSTGFLVVCFP